MTLEYSIMTFGNFGTLNPILLSNDFKIFARTKSQKNIGVVDSVRPMSKIFRAFGRSDRYPFADHGDTFPFEIRQTSTDDLGVGICRN